MTELVATSPDAAALVRLLSGTWQREFRTRLRVTAVTQAVVVSVLVHPVAPLLLLAGLVGWGSIWLSQRRRALGDADWHLLVDWWLDPLRSWTAHRWLLLLALGPSTGLAIGYIGEAAWGPAAASAAVALLLALFFRRALHPRSKWTAPVSRRSPRRRTR